MSGSVNKLQVAKVRTQLALNEFRHFLPLVTTLDEATNRKALWPTYLEYLNVIANELQYADDKVTWIPKSRRMMATWIVTAFALWETLRKDNYLALIQSQTESHSKDLMVDRIKLMYDNLPRWFRFFSTPNAPDWTTLDCRFRDRDSRLRAFPQGPAQFRQYTPSLIIVDEAAHQDEFDEAMAAIVPFLEKDTRVILLSSLAPSYFADIAYSAKATDPVTLFPGNESLPPERRRGVRKWKLQNGGSVLEVHYSADPSKDYEWLMRMDKEVAGGINGAQWRQEMELEKDAFSGQRVYEHFVPSRHVKKVEVHKNHCKWFAVDYGVFLPTAALGIAKVGMTEFGPKYHVYKEFYASGFSIDRLKAAFRLHFGPSEDFENEWIDPSTDSIREADSKTQYQLFNNGRNARLFQRADNRGDGIILISEWLHQDRLTIDPSCRRLIYEMENYRNQKWATEKQERKHNPKERVQKKDDHGPDALKYFANGVRHEELPEEQVDPVVHMMQEILEQIEMEDHPMYSNVPPIF